MRKRFYILFVARDSEGQLRKIPIPVHYLYVFLVGAIIGMFSVTGMAGSYLRMLNKVANFNQLRSEKEQLKSQYSQLELKAHEKDIEVASLGSLAGEVSALYGLKTENTLLPTVDQVRREDVQTSLDQLYTLRGSALTGVTASELRLGLGSHRPQSLADWAEAAAGPSLWPVTGRLTSSFGERIDPFNGEGAFHSGVDIATAYGTPVLAPADGVVTFADFQSGYGRLIKIEHANNISTRFGHLSAFAVAAGQRVRRGEVIGYVGASGRVTSPHLHYEVRINDTPVNPHKYLRDTLGGEFALGPGN